MKKHTVINADGSTRKIVTRIQDGKDLEKNGECIAVQIKKPITKPKKKRETSD